MKNYVQDDDIITVAAPAAVASGDAVLVGSLFGVAQTDAANGANVALVVRGVFDLPKATGQAWTVGQKLYWSTGNANLTTTATSNTLVGVATAAAASDATSGHIRLGIVA